jgi:hypothetical protein
MNEPTLEQQHEERDIRERTREMGQQARDQAGEKMRQWRDRAKQQMRGPVSHTEGGLARSIEHHTARLPSDTFLWTAGACIVASLALKMSGRDTDALFVGQWAPTFLILGLYNKIVKVSGHEHTGAEHMGD